MTPVQLRKYVRTLAQHAETIAVKGGAATWT